MRPINDPPMDVIDGALKSAEWQAGASYVWTVFGWRTCIKSNYPHVHNIFSHSPEPPGKPPKWARLPEAVCRWHTPR